ncbi:MAG: hypothetical protein MI923_19320 [Phycisphaerales bacterium]|nr:hypothetical protein [Phycisphaerales bacterium]
MESRSKLKLGLAGLLMAVAVGLSLHHFFSGESVPDIEETKTVWYCTDCDKSFELSGRQSSTMVSKQPAENRESDAGQPTPHRAGGRFVELARCPGCNEQSGVRARRCHDCETCFRARTEAGAITVCPKCRWNPVTDKKADEE